MPDKSVFDYSVKFYEEDGSYLDIDGFCIIVDVTDDPEDDRDEASHLADEKAEELMIQYEAHSYELTLEDAG